MTEAVSAVVIIVANAINTAVGCAGQIIARTVYIFNALGAAVQVIVTKAGGAVICIVANPAGAGVGCAGDPVITVSMVITNTTGVAGTIVGAYGIGCVSAGVPRKPASVVDALSSAFTDRSRWGTIVFGEALYARVIGFITNQRRATRVGVVLTNADGLVSFCVLTRIHPSVRRRCILTGFESITPDSIVAWVCIATKFVTAIA